MKKDKFIQPGNTPKTSEWESLNTEQLRLNVAHQKRELHMMESRVLVDKIEQARRNVEILLRTNGLFEASFGDVKELAKNVLMENLKIMQEVKDIK